MMMKISYAVLAAVLLAQLHAGERVWTGGGDGVRWSDPLNWGGTLPATGDDVRIVSGASMLSVTNDIEGLSVNTLSVSGGSEVVLYGNEIALTGTAYAFSNSVPTEVNCPLRLVTRDGALNPGANTVFNGKITFEASRHSISGLKNYVDMEFRGAVEGPDTELRNQSAGVSVKVSFYAPVHVKKISGSGDNGAFWHFKSSGNDIPDGLVNVNHEYSFDVRDALKDPVQIAFETAVYGKNAFVINSGFQVFGGFSGTRPNAKNWQNAHAVTAAVPAVVVLANAMDKSSYACLKGPLSLVYNPAEDVTQTFLDRIHTMNGTLTVKGGTLRMDGTNSFPSVCEVHVTGGTLDAAVTNTGAFASAKVLLIGENARLSVAPTAEDMFGTSATFARLRSSSRIVLPEGASLRVGALTVDGVPVAPGSYSRTADGTRAALDQVEGAGTLVVDATPSSTVWSGAAGNSDFGDAANWTAGIPSAAVAAFVGKPGNMEITLDSALAGAIRGVELENASGTTEFEVTAPLSVSGGSVSVGRGSVLTVGEGGCLVQDFTGAAATDRSDTFRVCDGGKFRIDGGNVSLEDTTGLLSIGGETSDDAGVFEVVSGTCTVSRASGDYLRLGYHGTLKMTGGYMNIADADMFTQNGGLIDLSGNAVLRYDTYSTSGGKTPHILKNVTLRMRENASLVSGVAKMRSVAFDASCDGGTCCIDMAGDSMLCITNGETFLGFWSHNAKTVIKMRERAVCIAPWNLRIGWGSGAYGELDIGDDARCFLDGYAYGISIAQNSSEEIAQGVLRISGGYVQAGTASIDNGFFGLTVGCSLEGHNPSPLARGFVYVSGGAITNHVNFFTLGVGPAEGTVEQSGGIVCHKGKNLFIVGLLGGSGTYKMTGGKLHVPSKNVYVGGVAKDEVGFDFSKLDERAGNGLLSVMGGTADLGESLFVSSGGYGVLEIGPTGRVDVADDVYLTNSLDTVKNLTAAAELRFVAGTDGFGVLTVGGACQVAEGSALEIDVTNLGKRGSSRILSCGSLEGRFAEENISVTGSSRGAYLIEQTDSGIRIKRRGFFINVR